MKQAILIQCHKNPDQINMLLDALNNPNLDIFIHVDKKSKITSEIKKNKMIHILPDEYRVDVGWATFSQVEATLNLMKYAAEYGEYGHFMLCSGQDYPLASAERIFTFLNEKSNANFVQLWSSKNAGENRNNYDKRTEIYYPTIVLGKAFFKRVAKRILVELTGGYNRTWKLLKRKQLKNIDFYFGSQWICISKEFEKWIEDYLQKNPEYIKFYKHTNCPDESFFQTLLMNSPYKKTRCDYLHYIDWSLGGNSPKNLDESDIAVMLESGKMMARKFEDISVIRILEKMVNVI